MNHTHMHTLRHTAPFSQSAYMVTAYVSENCQLTDSFLFVCLLFVVVVVVVAAVVVVVVVGGGGGGSGAQMAASL